MQGGHQERGTAAGRVADLQGEDDLGRLRRERAVLGLVVAERLQRAVDGRHGQLRPGVERPGPLAGVPGPDEIELARGHDPLDEPVRLALDASADTRCPIPWPSACPPSPASTTASLAQLRADSTASR